MHNKYMYLSWSDLNIISTNIRHRPLRSWVKGITQTRNVYSEIKYIYFVYIHKYECVHTARHNRRMVLTFPIDCVLVNAHGDWSILRSVKCGTCIYCIIHKCHLHNGNLLTTNSFELDLFPPRMRWCINSVSFLFLFNIIGNRIDI